jgi:mitogen-activated protein kinase kinase 1
VHSCDHGPTGTVFALKVVPLDVRDALRRRIIAELRCLHASLSCPAIVPMHGAFLCDGSVAIVLEFMDAGSLSDLLTSRGTPMGESHVVCVAARVLLGVSYLHGCCHIIHRDLKPSNLLLNSRGEVKISDFGVSGQLRPGQPQSSSWLGTTRYMAPERIDGRTYSYSSDIWALGITLLECATGTHPYHDGDVAMSAENTATAAAAAPDFWALRERITQDAAPRLEPGRGFSAQGCDFLAHCLQKEADHRWSADQLSTHPWVAPSPGGDDPAGEAGERILAALVATVARDRAHLQQQQQQQASALPAGMRLRASPSMSTLHTVEE